MSGNLAYRFVVECFFLICRLLVCLHARVCLYVFLSAYLPVWCLSVFCLFSVYLSLFLKPNQHPRLNSLRPSDAYMRQQTNHPWVRWWLVAWPAPSHYLNQCWNIVNSNLRYKLQWNHKQNSFIFTQENAFENVVCEMVNILSRLQCVKGVFALITQKSAWNVPACQI